MKKTDNILPKKLDYPFNWKGRLELKLGRRREHYPDFSLQQTLKFIRKGDIDEAKSWGQSFNEHYDSFIKMKPPVDYNKRIDDYNKQRQTKAGFPLFPAIDWLNTGLNGGGWKWPE
jgi:hypothetical protein